MLSKITCIRKESYRVSSFGIAENVFFLSNKQQLEPLIISQSYRSAFLHEQGYKCQIQSHSVVDQNVLYG